MIWLLQEKEELDKIIAEENLDSEALQGAIAGCPVNAISITEDTEEN